jgi:hypothetical protein
MVSEDENNKKEGRGFSSLSSLLSTIESEPSNQKNDVEDLSASRLSSKNNPSQPNPTERHPGQQALSETAAPSSGGSSSAKWFFGIAAVIGILWIVGQSNETVTSSAAYRAPVESPPLQNAQPTYSLPTKPQAPSRPTESKPPVGQDLVFSNDQIRYCLAEEIRMEGAKSALNSYSDQDVRRFNSMVADYNSRCGSFRYRSGSLESARGEIEAYRGALQSEGGARFPRPSNDLASKRASMPSPPAAVASPPASAPTDTSSTSSTSTANFGPPANSFVSGSNWYCKEGFRKVGSECEALVVPPNAFVSGSNWYCKEGFRRTGDKCTSVFVQ